MLILYEYIERFFVHYGYTVEMLFAVSIFAFHLERRNWFILRAAGSYCLVLAGYAVFYRSLAWQSIGLTLLFYFFIDLFPECDGGGEGKRGVGPGMGRDRREVQRARRMNRNM